MIRRVVTTSIAIVVLAFFGMCLYVRMPIAAPLDDGANAIAYARATLDHAALPALKDDARDQRGLPVVVSLFERGEPRERGIGHGDTFGAALRDALGQLRAVDASHARIKLDRVVGRGRLSRMIAPMLALGVVPGRDGVGGEGGGRDAMLTVDELLRQGLWGHYVVVPAMEFSFGIEPSRLLRALATRLGAPPTTVFRFRSEEWVESATRDTALPVIAGRTPGPEWTKASVLEATRLGGEYLMSHLSQEGQFDYEYFTIEDTRVAGAEYSLPRHAGSTSFLAQLYGVEHDPRVRGAAERAIDYLARQRPPGCDGERVCVGAATDTEVDLGSAALSLVAALEYARVTDDHRYRPFEDGLVRFILAMQKPDGEFCHLFYPAEQRRDEKTQLLYYSGEAAYGLGLLLKQRGGAGDPAIVTALDRSLHYLTDTQYANLAGQFYIGEDHWTCMALDAGWEFLPADHRAKYGDFCDAFSAFMRKTQFRRTDALAQAQPWIVGSYGISAVMTPHNTPVGSRSESLISIWRMDRKRGLPDDDRRVHDTREQIEDGMRYLLQHQIRDDGAYLMTDAAAARGGFLMSDTERYIRIDFVQHSGSSLLRSLELL